MIPTTKKPYTVIALRHGGTHMIIPTVRYLTGGTVYSPKGNDALTCQPGKVVIVFTRDPRNWLVSFFRWKGGERGDDMALSRFMGNRRKIMTPLEFATQWADRWMEWPGALLCRFENLIPPEGERETARIARFLKVEPRDVHKRVFGQSGTFTGKPSNWREWFGPESERAFARSGGTELLARMGYA